MKCFIYVKTQSNMRYFEGVNVYQIIRNKPVFLFHHEYDYRSSCDTETEVFRELINRKIIPESLYNISKNPERSGGRYCTEVAEKGISIKQLI